MGYSCNAAAAYTRDAIVAELAAMGITSSNGMPGGGFFEIGRENADGAITGTVWRLLNAAEKTRYADLDNLDARVVRRGSFRIEPDGSVSRFPGLPAALLRRAEREGQKTFDRSHGPREPFDWRRTRDLLLECLREPSPASVRHLWNDIQAVAGAYQRECGVMFLALPGMEPADVREFLGGLN